MTTKGTKMGMIVVLLILAAVVGTGVWLTMTLKSKGDDVLDAEPIPKKGGSELTRIKPDRIESEIKVEAQAVVQLRKHEIVSTDIGWDLFMNWETYKWRCRCGVGGKDSNEYCARRSSQNHVSSGNKAEELRAQTNGRRSW